LQGRKIKPSRHKTTSQEDENIQLKEIVWKERKGQRGGSIWRKEKKANEETKFLEQKI
jgi:hypothetical protein